MMRVLGVFCVAFALNEEKNRAVTKVLNLLKQMREELETEAKNDQEVYDKLTCWCKTNDTEKTESIKKANSQIEELKANIDEFTATSARLSSEIKQLETEIDQNQKALDKATGIRRKETGQFNAEEKDVIQSVRALKSAITALKKHNTAMLQGDMMQNIQALVKATLEKHQATVQEAVSPSQQRTLSNFVQAPSDFKSYQNRSGQIFGILESMLDTFESNLSASQRDELESQRQFEELKKAKEEEISAATEQLNKNKEQRANTDTANAEAKQNLEDTEKSLAADEEFLGNLREKCAQTDREFEARVAARNEEIEAVGQALEILSGDDAHDNFTATFNFVQVSDTRQQAATLIKKVAQKYDSPQLSILASSVRLDAFTKVKEAINNMVQDLQTQKDEDIKHKDWCNNQLHEIQLDIDRNQRDLEEHTANKEDAETDVANLKADLELLNAEVADLHKQVKRAGENRAKENAEFQQTVQEQRETKRLLNKAIGVLAAVFEKKKKALMQQEPPTGFKTYSQNKNSGGVLGMLRQIVADTTKLEAEAIRDEADAQSAYESFVKESNKSINAKSKSIVNKSEQKAERQQTAVDEKEAADNSETKLEEANDSNGATHSSCDFALKNFDIRQQAFEEEMEALRQAKSILSGSNFGSFLQRAF